MNMSNVPANRHQCLCTIKLNWKYAKKHLHMMLITPTKFYFNLSKAKEEGFPKAFLDRLTKQSTNHLVTPTYLLILLEGIMKSIQARIYRHEIGLCRTTQNVQVKHPYPANSVQHTSSLPTLGNSALQLASNRIWHRQSDRDLWDGLNLSSLSVLHSQLWFDIQSR